MIAEELRDELLRDADAITSKPGVRWVLGQERLRRVRAMRRFWLEATTEELNRLLELVRQEPL